MKTCRDCPGEAWCENRGCIVWNERSREQYYELERRSKQMNAEIDELEKLFGPIVPVGTGRDPQ